MAKPVLAQWPQILASGALPLLQAGQIQPIGRYIRTLNSLKSGLFLTFGQPAVVASWNVDPQILQAI
jgi:hypothetical protein